MIRPSRVLPAALVMICTVVQAAPAFEAALALVKDKRYPEARAAFEAILAADPRDAAAHHQLGHIIRLRRDNPSYELALNHFSRAVELAPQNAAYLADYGGTSLEYAARSRSISAATKGRDAMERAIVMDPTNLAAREGLYEFYRRAPWPLGSNAKADAHLAEIRKRDSARADALAIGSLVSAKDYAGAFKLCDALLAKDPSNYGALYAYGRTASVSGQNLDRGLAALEQCLTLEPPSPAAPQHFAVHNRIGIILEKLNRPADARRAYEAVLKLDPGNRSAKDALTRLEKTGS